MSNHALFTLQFDLEIDKERLLFAQVVKVLRDGGYTHCVSKLSPEANAILDAIPLPMED